MVLPNQILENKKKLIDMNKFKLTNSHKSHILEGLRSDIIEIKAGRFKLKTTSTQEILMGCVK